MKQHCEHWSISKFESDEETGFLAMQVECDYPAIGMLNGVPVCEKHEQKWRESHGLESK